MGLFGKSKKEKEQEAQAAHREAQRKLQEAQRRQQQEAARKAAAKPAPAPGAPKPAAAAGGAVAPAGAKPQAVPASQPAPANGEYTVQKGDSLSKIAKKHLGDANAWKKIYEANKAVIGDDPDKIFPGQKLKLPAGGTRLA